MTECAKLVLSRGAHSFNPGLYMATDLSLRIGEDFLHAADPCSQWKPQISFAFTHARLSPTGVVFDVG